MNKRDTIINKKSHHEYFITQRRKLYERIIKSVSYPNNAKNLYHSNFKCRISTSSLNTKESP